MMKDYTWYMIEAHYKQLRELAEELIALLGYGLADDEEELRAQLEKLDGVMKSYYHRGGTYTDHTGESVISTLTTPPLKGHTPEGE
jgi:hypothetical protein